MPEAPTHREPARRPARDDGPRVFVLGVARSGTSALYAVVQSLLRHRDGVVPRSVYEPFLWGEPTWHRAYGDVADAFDRMSSVSWEGVACHKRLPLFSGPPPGAEDRRYLEDCLAGADGSRSLVAKFVRANGRIPLLRTIVPDARFVLVLRNPVDVLNSSKRLFSLLGSDFFESDWARLRSEVARLEPGAVPELDAAGPLEREALWWYHMNLAALRTFESERERSAGEALVLEYGRLAGEPGSTTRAICAALGVPFVDGLVGAARRQHGPRTRTVNLSRREFDSLGRFVDRYCELLERFDVPHDFDRGALERRYAGRLRRREYSLAYQGATPGLIRRQRGGALRRVAGWARRAWRRWLPDRDTT